MPDRDFASSAQDRAISRVVFCQGAPTHTPEPPEASQRSRARTRLSGLSRLALHGLPDVALIEMGDFVGGMLKYLRTHAITKVTIAGGFAKMTKLGQGFLDLHSRRGEVDLSWLAAHCAKAGAGDDLIARAKTANSAREVLDLASAEGIDIGATVAEAAWCRAAKVLHGRGIALEIAIFDRDGHLLARTPFLPVH
jgi:cobalt-precorrin-5B (C1)-methyltransferase